MEAKLWRPEGKCPDYLSKGNSFLLSVVSHIMHFPPLHVLPVLSFGIPFLSFLIILLPFLSSLFCLCGIFISSSKSLVRISNGVIFYVRWNTP